MHPLWLQYQIFKLFCLSYRYFIIGNSFIKETDSFWPCKKSFIRSQFHIIFYPRCFKLLKLITISSHLFFKANTFTVNLTSDASFIPHCNKMLMCWSPLSARCLASLPHVLESSWCPPVPNPILESQNLHSFSLLPRMPILASVNNNVEPFSVAVGLQGSLRADQRFPRVTTQWGGPVLSVSN